MVFDLKATNQSKSASSSEPKFYLRFWPESYFLFLAEFQNFEISLPVEVKGQFLPVFTTGGSAKTETEGVFFTRV